MFLSRWLKSSHACAALLQRFLCTAFTRNASLNHLLELQQLAQACKRSATLHTFTRPLARMYPHEVFEQRGFVELSIEQKWFFTGVMIHMHVNCRLHLLYEAVSTHGAWVAAITSTNNHMCFQTDLVAESHPTPQTHAASFTILWNEKKLVTVWRTSSQTSKLVASFTHVVNSSLGWEISSKQHAIFQA